MNKKWNDAERFWRDESDKMTESQKIPVIKSLNIQGIVVGLSPIMIRVL